MARKTADESVETKATATKTTAVKATAAKKAVGPPDGPARVILIQGTEAPQKIARAHDLARLADPDFADFDVETIDGPGATIEQILGAVATVPFGTGRRVVIVRDPQQMDIELQKKLAVGVGNIPASGLLVLLSGTPVIEDGKTKRGTTVATELLNAAKKLGEVHDFAPARAEDLRAAVLSEARGYGKTLAPDALAMLLQLPSDDLRHVISEVQKAALHAGENKTISVDDVEATLSRGPDDVIFKLCDAVGARRPKEALAHVSTLFRGGGRPDSIAPRALVMLARQIRLVAQFRYLGEKRMAGRNAQPPTPEVLALLPSDGAGAMAANPRMSWMSDKYVAQARNFTGAELAERMERLLEADLRLKGSLPGGENPQAVLQRLVAELC